jgi:hypothetical protein
VTVSLLHIVAAARAHLAPLAAESAGYLLLAAADQVATSPRSIQSDDVELLPDGAVRLRAGDGGGAGAEGAELALRRLLAHTLEVSSSVGPALRRAAARSEPVGLGHLVRELETALIPVNRAAARRALSRLHRETERALRSGALGSERSGEQTSAVAPLAEEAALPESSPALPESSPALPQRLPQVAAVPPRSAPPTLKALEPTPEPRSLQAEPALTKPEPVVERARARRSQTPALGTSIVAQTLPEEDSERTERSPPVLPEPETSAALEATRLDSVRTSSQLARAAPEPEPARPEPSPSAPERLAFEPEPAPSALDADPEASLSEPEPSALPDVVTAMAAWYTGFEEDEIPTRIRNVVTALRTVSEPVASAFGDAHAPRAVASETELPVEAEPVVASEAEPVVASEAEPVVASEAELPVDVEPVGMVEVTLQGETAGEAEPEWTTLFISELGEPAMHEALTWDPGPVVSSSSAALAPSLVIGEPEPELSPYAPAVLPSTQSDVAALLESFHLSGATEERELRGALKEMAGLELTPMPHPLVEDA